jgi:polyferredoxin
MQKVGYAPGLIKYTTEHALTGRSTRLLRPRVIGYAAALSIMVVAFSVALVNRSLLGIDVIRDRGELFHEDRDAIRNDYTLKIINKTQAAQSYALTLAGDAHGLTFEGPAKVDVDAGEVANVPVSLAIEPAKLDSAYFDVRFQACDGASHCDTETNRFFGPTR